MRGKYFIDYLKSFTLGSPEYAEGWKATIIAIENDDCEVAAFKIPKKRLSEIVVLIEKLIKDKDV
jgi:hypothetical protein